MPTKIYMTNGKTTENILSLGMKGIDPWDETRPGVWTPDNTKQDTAPRLVPSVFASVSLRMQAMADLPFTIYTTKGDKEADRSDKYQNAVGFLPNPHKFLSLTEGAFVLSGQSYWYKGKGAKTGAVKDLQYWRPDSVTLDSDAARRGVIQFNRANQKYPSDNVFYLWLPDPLVELGAPIAYPLSSALLAATASGAISQWAADYMQRGAVKAMMLMVDDAPPPGEVERMESWFNRFMRGARNLAWKVFNASGVKPTIIGDGLDALGDLAITADLRNEINIAMGTQFIFDAQAYATSQKALERQFYQLTIMPDARIIQSGINEQILHPMGYHLEFEPQRLESFQEDEDAQVQSFGALLDILMKGLSFDTALRIASEKMDYPFTDEQMSMIEADLADNGNPPEPPAQTEPVPPSPIPPEPQVNAKALVELDRWEAKSAKAGKIVTWHAAALSDDMVKAISSGSMTFDQARDRLRLSNKINNAVANAENSIMALAAAIERATNANA